MKINNITIETLPYVKNNVLFKENVIIFVISIPNFVKGNYFRTIIKKIPNKNNSLELDSTIEKVIICNQDIFVNVEKRNIMKKELITYKDQCISKLLKNEQIKCNYHKNVTESIESLSNGIVITKNLRETLLVNNCGQQMGIKIRGNNIIKFTNCSISVSDLRFENTMGEYHPMILPYVEQNITIQQVVNEGQLEYLHHENINKIEVTTKQRWHLNLMIDSTILVVIFVIGIYVYIHMRCRRRSTHVNIRKLSPGVDS